MKFDKFFKLVGTHGQVIKTVNNRWLCCGGVGMRIPEGVNAFGVNAEPDEIFNAILDADIDEDILDLVKAELPKDGKPSDISRIFATTLGDEIKISNTKYGLLEKGDRLVYLEIEDSNDKVNKFMLITDIKGEDILGFIAGSEE